ELELLAGRRVIGRGVQHEADAAVRVRLDAPVAARRAAGERSIEALPRVGVAMLVERAKSFAQILVGFGAKQCDAGGALWRRRADRYRRREQRGDQAARDCRGLAEHRTFQRARRSSSSTAAHALKL